MRNVFSREGFDRGSGGKPSAILDDRPISLLIPTKRRSATLSAFQLVSDFRKKSQL